jgi:RNA polymerase sigma-70 factor, ECF subfamily
VEVAGLLIETENVQAEERLVEAAVTGDVQAFTALYDKYLNRVYRYVYYRVRNRADAEDLTQQVFLRAWGAINRYTPTGVPFAGWLLTIAHNLVVDFLRRAKPVDPLEEEPTNGQRWADPEGSAIARHDALAVQRAISWLKPAQQQVILLRFFEHMSCSDVAATLNKSEVSVRVMQHRALAELRRLLDREVRG